MFLEELVLTLLTKLLGPYIAGLTREKLRVGVWEGNVVLRDLELREEALDALGLPVSLRRGRIGSLQIRVPWSRLRSEAVEICVEELVLLASMREAPEEGAHERREAMQKRMRLDAEEALRKLRESTPGRHSLPSESRMTRLLRAVVDRVRFKLLRLHVRYEHPAPANDERFACGVMLQCLEVSSSDTDIPVEEADARGGWLHRVVSLRGTSVYWHADAPMHEERLRLLGPAASHQPPLPIPEAFVLPPTDVTLHAMLLRGGGGAAGTSTHSRCTCSVEQPVRLSFMACQLRGVLQLTAHLGRLAQRERYCRQRALCLGEDGASAVRRWRFAVRCAQDEARASRRWRPVAAAVAFAARRRQYAAAWRDVLAGGAPTGRLLEMEAQLPLADILLFRALAERSLAPRAAAASEAAPRGRFVRSASDGQLRAAPSEEWAAAGVAASDGVAAAWEVRLQLRALRLAFASPRGGEAAVHAEEVALLLHADVGGHSAAHLTLGGLCLRGGGREIAALDGEPPHAELGPSAGGARRVAQLRLEARPAGSALPPRLDAARYLRLALAPLRARLTPAAAAAAREWLALAGEEPPPAALVTPPASALSLDLALGGVEVHLVDERTHTARRSDEPSPPSLPPRGGSIGALASTPPRDSAATPPADESLPSTATSPPQAPSSPPSLLPSPRLSDTPPSLLNGDPPPPNGSSTSALQLTVGLVRFATTTPPLDSASAAPPPSDTTAAHQRVDSRGSFEMLSITAAHLSFGGPAEETHALLLPFDVSAELRRGVGEEAGRCDARVRLPQLHAAVEQKQLAPLAALAHRFLAADARLSPPPPPPPRLAPNPSWSLALNVDRLVVELRSSRAHATVGLHDLELRLAQQSSEVRAALAVRSAEAQLSGRGRAALAQLRARQLSLTHRAGGVPPQPACASLELGSCGLTILAPPPAAAAAAAPPLGCAFGPGDGAGVRALLLFTPASVDASVEVSRGVVSLGDVAMAARPIADCLLLAHQLSRALSPAVPTQAGPLQHSPLAAPSGQPVSVTLRGCLRALTLQAVVRPRKAASSIAERSPHPAEMWVALKAERLELAYPVAGGDASSGELLLSSLCVASILGPRAASNEPVWLLRPAQLKLAWASPSAEEARVQLHVDRLEAALPFDTVVELSEYLKRCAASRRAISRRWRRIRADTPPSPPPPEASRASSALSVHFRLEAAVFELLAPSAPNKASLAELSYASAVRRHSRVAHLTLALRQVRLSVYSPPSGECSGALHFANLRVLTGYRAADAAAGAAIGGVALIELTEAATRGGDEAGDAAPLCSAAQPRLEVEMRPGIMLCQLALPLLHVCVGLVEVQAAASVWAPRLGPFMAAMRMPDPSDVPFVVDLTVAAVELRLLDSAAAPAAGLSCHWDLAARLDMSGGVSLPPLIGWSASVQTLTLHALFGSKWSPVLTPVQATLRSRSYDSRRLRAALHLTDVQLQISHNLLQTVLSLRARVGAVVQAFEATPSVALADASLIAPVMRRSPSSLSSEKGMDAMSESSDHTEYFDAEEQPLLPDCSTPHAATPASTDAPLPDAATDGRSPAKPVDAAELQQRDVRVELHMGKLTATLIDDCSSYRSAPLLHASLSPESALLVRATGGGAFVSIRLWLSLSYFKRQLRDAPNGWEPVLSPCPVDVALDCGLSQLSVGSSGFVQFDVSTCLLRTLLSFQRHLRLSDQVRASTQVPFAVFSLVNDTGSALRFAFEGESTNELAPGSTAACAEAPSALRKGRALTITFDGFQSLDMHPPYRDRYRLWPISHSGSATPIIYVLASSSPENSSLTLRSPFILENSSPEAISVHLTKKDAGTTGGSHADISLLLEPGTQRAVPFLMLPCWLDAHQPELRPQGDLGTVPPERIELALVAMQALRSRGPVLLGDSTASPSNSGCYAVTASYSAGGWIVSLQAPLILHNALLTSLEFELSETHVAVGEQTRTSCGMLARESSMAIFQPCRAGLYLRARCSGFHWSQPHDIGLEQVGGQSACILRCASAESVTTHFGPIEHGAPSLSLQMCVARSLQSVSVEVSGRVWVVNECHIPLRCQPVGLNACSNWQHVPPSRGDESTPIALMGVDASSDLLISTVPPEEFGVVALPFNLQAALLSIPGLLQSEEQSDDFILDVTLTDLQGQLIADAAQHAAYLHLGARLMPLQHKHSSSMLMIIAPRFVLVNQTSQNIQLAQPDSDALVNLLPSSPAGDLVRWTPVHWHDLRNRHVLLRRTDRGAAWSGRVPLAFVASAPSELTLRLRNVETDLIEFPRLSTHRLQGRATTAIVFRDEFRESAPMLIQNLTDHEVCFQQSGVAVVGSLPPGTSCKYAWDEPAAPQQLQLHVPSLGIHFRCDVSPRRVVRPWLAGLLPGLLRSQPRVELSVVSEGAVTRFVLCELVDEAPALRHSSFTRARRHGAEVSSTVLGGSTWQLKLDFPGIGVTLIDDFPRELLHHSLRGVRFTARAYVHETCPRLSMALAVASVQLDSQLPRESPLEEVLLQGGVASRVDAISAQMTISHELGLLVLHQACLTLQEITLRLDEQVLDTVGSVLQAQVADSLELPRATSPACPTSSLLRDGIHGELARAAVEMSGQRVFVKQLRLNPIKLKLSWRSSRPDAPASAPLIVEPGNGTDGGERAVSGSVLRWLRWLGITLIGLEDAPVRLPEVALQRAVLPVETLLTNLGQRYLGSLVGAVQKLLLPSAALLGDPYGTLRTLRQGWHKQRQKLRRTPWRRWPLVATYSASLMLRASVANMLNASGRSILALSAGLEAFLSQEGGMTLHKQAPLPEAIVRGVGSIAIEAAQTLDIILARLRRVVTLPAALEGIFLSALLPLGTLHTFSYGAAGLRLYRQDAHGLLGTFRRCNSFIRTEMLVPHNTSRLPNLCTIANAAPPAIS
ncbi:hypothetical protein AB1Y20_005186 [Prymnesium parvum]|uniref:Uncharacterized protein n=1 Tax=Prymnesium parvum TaxID=97485 RepID=A0AB34J548_PRYPA